MRRRSVFIAATGLCIAGLAIAVILVTHKPSGLLFVSEIPNVHDGDTIYYQERSFCLPTQGVRLLGIDTPELAEAGGHNAQDAFQDIVDECDGRFWIDAPEEVQDDPNRRLVAILLVNQRDQVSVNEQLVLDGWARIYRMPDSSDKLQGLEQRLLKAQIEAALNRRGNWAEGGDVVVAAIQYWTDPEQVVLVNRGEESVPVEDWYLLDPEPERPNLFRLQDVFDMPAIPPMTSVSFVTRKQWDNAGDSAELYDQHPNEGASPLDIYEYGKI